MHPQPDLQILRGGGVNDCDKKIMAFINYKLSYSTIFTLLYTYINSINHMYNLLIIYFFKFES